MQSPVEEGEVHRAKGRLGGFGAGHRWVLEVGDGFGNAVVDQADTHAGGKHHGNPGPGVEFRSGIVRAQTDGTVAAEHQRHHEDQEQRSTEDVEPAEIGGDEVLHRVRDIAESRGKDHGQRHQHQNDRTRCEKHRRVGMGVQVVSYARLHAASLRGFRWRPDCPCKPHGLPGSCSLSRHACIRVSRTLLERGRFRRQAQRGAACTLYTFADSGKPMQIRQLGAAACPAVDGRYV